MVSAKNSITVVCASDDNYAMPLAVTAASIIKNLDPQRHLDLYVLDDGISNLNKDKIAKSIDLNRCTLEWINTKGKFSNAATLGHISGTTYHRLLIPNLLPVEISKAIYLDCDIVVLSDIGKLWDIEIGQNSLLAVQENGCNVVSDELSFFKGLSSYKELGIPANWKYFNAGVLVLNLDKWRKDGITEKLIDYINKPRDFVMSLADQEALNAVLWDQWGELDFKWNCMVRATKERNELVVALQKSIGALNEAKYVEDFQNPYIKHFNEETKPWRFYRHIDKKIFYKYLDLTSWAGWRYSAWKVLVKKIKSLSKK